MHGMLYECLISVNCHRKLWSNMNTNFLFMSPPVITEYSDIGNKFLVKSVEFWSSDNYNYVPER
jgi:hypothetical protein